jgi:hypothetical protein
MLIYGLVDLGKEGGKVLRAVLLLATRDHLPGSDVQSSEEIERPVADVVMRSPFRLADVHGQDGLRAFQGLDL